MGQKESVCMCVCVCECVCEQMTDRERIVRGETLLRPGYCNTCSLCIISASPKREVQNKKNTNKMTADIFHLIPQIFCAVYFDIVGF